MDKFMGALHLCTSFIVGAALSWATVDATGEKHTRVRERGRPPIHSTRSVAAWSVASCWGAIKAW